MSTNATPLSRASGALVSRINSVLAIMNVCVTVKVIQHHRGSCTPLIPNAGWRNRHNMFGSMRLQSDDHLLWRQEC
jgi:hypothetical protein